VFPSSELDLPLVTADAAATRLASPQLERELATIGTPAIVERVRAALAAGAISSVEVARTLRVSPRTLKRRLADHGTTFTALRDEHRRQRALLLLADRDLTLTDVASRLGYTELPNFTRAFRRWTGTTPTAHRDGLK
jgi:AraC-like DNA-binding protein